MTLTSHILDTSTGRPAVAVSLTLFKQTKIGDDIFGPEEEWGPFETNQSDEDGRASMSWDRKRIEAVALGTQTEGVYRLRFYTEEHFWQEGRETFYPFVDVVFRVVYETEHYHVTLQINPFGYTTRGS